MKGWGKFFYEGFIFIFKVGVLEMYFLMVIFYKIVMLVIKILYRDWKGII